MSLLRWDDKYLLGNDLIDGDHQALFAMINEFYDAFQETRRRRDLAGMLTKLVNYAEAHFQREESLMVACGYPALEEHHDLHTGLYETIYALNERLASEPGPVDRQAVLFLKTWLVDHIVQHDLKLGEFMRQKISGS